MKTKIIFAAIAAVMLSACNSEVEKPSIITGDSTPLNVAGSKAIGQNNRIIYEMNIYSVSEEGTFKAAEQKLDELNSLGVDIVWLMPVYKRAGSNLMGDPSKPFKVVGSPYAISDFRALNPDFGTVSDMKQFVDKAHSLGMKVWLDWVANHTSFDNVWMTSHPEFYVKDDEGKADIVRDINGNEIYPDVYQLDFQNPSLRSEMINSMKYWLNETGIDGFRFDYVSGWRILQSTFWQEVVDALHKEKADIELLAEADFTDSNCSKLVPLGFNYDYSWAMHTRMHELPKSESVASLQNQAEGLYNTKLYDNMSRMSYVTNHDDYNDKEAYPAYYSNKLGEGNYALCDVLTFTFYGMPLLYNGQEIGYPRVISFFHKEPINWSAGDKRTTNTVSTLAYLRHTCPALSDGNAEERAEMQMLQTNPSASSMAYIKKKGDQTMLVVLNFGKEQSVYVYQTPEGEYTQVLDSRTIADGPSQRDVEIKGAPKGVCEFPMERKGYAIYIKK